MSAVVGVKPPRKRVSPYTVKPKPVLKIVSRNDRRRERYALDEEYQEALKLRSRSSYRQNNKIELDNCLRSLNFYETLAVPLQVGLPNGAARQMPVMTLANVANCLGKIYQTIWRWKQRGMIPEPALVLAGRGTAVYHVQEVRVLIEEIGSHEKVMAYYRADHTEVTERINQRIGEIRKRWR